MPLSEASIVAPRRILQLAVRDAVATYRPSIMDSEPSLKRPRSLVYSSINDPPTDNLRQRLKSIASVPKPLSTALKAVADSSDDVNRSRSSVNVFDRLGSRTGNMESSAYSSEGVEQHDEYLEFHGGQIQASGGDFKRRNARGRSELESEAGLDSNSVSDNDDCDDDIDMGGHGEIVDSSLTRASKENKTDDSLLVQYSVSQTGDEIVSKARINEQDQLSAGYNASQKIVNISVNVNTWKPSHYPAERVAPDSNVQKLVDGTLVNDSERQAMKEIHTSSLKHENQAITGSQKDSKKLPNVLPVPCSISNPCGDLDFRTVFVSNVHFAANKDNLSRHFNKFGEVSKVVILTDAATGQPKGAAYVEFAKKQAAELALSVDGTSFMSRIVKVVRSRGREEERGGGMTRGAAPVQSRYPRGLQRGGRSLQWKRGTGTVGAATSGVTFKAARALTYVRTT